MTEPSASVTILGPGWPGRALRVMPGDLSQWLPQGLGLGAPLIVTAYSDGPEPGYYGFDAAGPNPILNAPTQQPASGVLYFDDGADLTKLRGALELIGVRLVSKTYAVFWDAAIDTIEDRYLHQVRLVSKAALASLFRASPEAAALPEQPLALGDYVETFISEQKDKWNDGYAFSRHLSGTLGGDGDWAKESLGFGFAVENGYWGVYRLWSRPWLCTK
jgi:hypothetical protein